MAAVIANIDPAKITEYRETFLKEKAADIENDVFDKRDIERLKTDDDYVKCFVDSSRSAGDSAKGVLHIEEVFIFRKKMNIWDSKIEDIPAEILEKETFVYKNVDKNGQKILHFRVEKHDKSSSNEELKKLLTLLFEQHHKENAGKSSIVFIFDFTNSGLKNADLDMVKFVLNSVTIYFPRIVAYILLFEMPFLLGAVWKVVQAWLSAEQKKFIKFVKKADITEYINEDNLESHMKI